MPIVSDFQCPVQIYRENFEQLPIPRPLDCPHCQASDTFIGHGCYWRKALNRREDYRIRIKRWLCKACRRTVSILPSFLLRHRHYLLAVIQDVVTARLTYAWLQCIVTPPGPVGCRGTTVGDERGTRWAKLKRQPSRRTCRSAC